MTDVSVSNLSVSSLIDLDYPSELHSSPSAWWTNLADRARYSDQHD